MFWQERESMVLNAAFHFAQRFVLSFVFKALRDWAVVTGNTFKQVGKTVILALLSTLFSYNFIQKWHHSFWTNRTRRVSSEYRSSTRVCRLCLLMPLIIKCTENWRNYFWSQRSWWSQSNGDTQPANYKKVQSYKYLGVHVDNTLIWNAHVDWVCPQLLQRMFFVFT